MLLEVYDGKTFTRIDIIRTFDFVQYVLSFNGIGDFTLSVPLSERSLQYLKKGNMILFDIEALGIIKYIKKEDSNVSYVTIKGKMVKVITTYRSFLKTENYQGSVSEIVVSILNKNIITPDDTKRKIVQVSISSDEKYMPTSDGNYTVQYTGKQIHYGIQSILDNNKWGYDIIPIFKNVSEESNTNISTLEFRIIQSIDRTIGNDNGIAPVVFTKELGNIKNTVYVEDATNYANVMLVAGEGTGTDRIVLEVGDEQAIGLDRIEYYVDARDLQKTKDDGAAMTDDEYNEILKQRGKDKQEEHVSFIYFDGTVVINNTSFILGKDYNVGDFVSVIDKELNLVLNLQIVSVTKSLTGTGEVTDITFGYNNVTVRELLKKEGVI